ncbi:MAG: hypothetical protein HY332_10080 [Chloroflexi bacterium]|nr:hypothetical protein [Chloroflexota bacterium]
MNVNVTGQNTPSALDFDTALNKAIDRLRAGSPIDECVAASPRFADDLRPLLELTQMTLQLAPVPAPADVKARVRARVMAAAEAKLNRRPWWHTAASWLAGGPAWRLPPVGVAAAVVAFAVFGGGGAVVAAAHSLPGDTLYPIKLAVEDVRLAAARVTSGEDAQAALRNEIADRRVHEAKALADHGRTVPPGLIEAALRHAEAADQLVAALPDGKRVEVATALAASESQRAATLHEVWLRVPEPAKPAIEHAIQQGQAKRADKNQSQNERGDDRSGRSTTADARTPATATPAATPAATATTATGAPATGPTGAQGGRQEDRREDRQEDRGSDRDGQNDRQEDRRAGGPGERQDDQRTGDRVGQPAGGQQDRSDSGPGNSRDRDNPEGRGGGSGAAGQGGSRGASGPGGRGNR